MHHDDDYLFPPSSYDERELSHTPPMFTYSTYPPPPEEMMMSQYGAYRPMPAESYQKYLSPPPVPVPVTLPSLTHFSDAIKREPGYPGGPGAEEGLSYMSYNGYQHIPGVDMGPAGHPSPYEQMPHVSCLLHPLCTYTMVRYPNADGGFRNTQTPPLSHSYDHSAACSDSGSYEAYPTTPLSMPGSPNMTQQQS
jgi:hypothetical protein